MVSLNLQPAREADYNSYAILCLVILILIRVFRTSVHVAIFLLFFHLA